MVKSYGEIYKEVLESGNYSGTTNKIKRIAQILYANNKHTHGKEECAMWALEMYEEMTGRYIDPTVDELEDITNSIM